MKEYSQCVRVVCRGHGIPLNGVMGQRDSAAMLYFAIKTVICLLGSLIVHSIFPLHLLPFVPLNLVPLDQDLYSPKLSWLSCCRLHNSWLSLIFFSTAKWTRFTLFSIFSADPLPFQVLNSKGNRLKPGRCYLTLWFLSLLMCAWPESGGWYCCWSTL